MPLCGATLPRSLDYFRLRFIRPAGLSLSSSPPLFYLTKSNDSIKLNDIAL